MRGMRIGSETRRSFCLLLFFIALFGYMPTNLNGDQRIWIGATLLLVICTLLDAKSKKIKPYIGNSYWIYFLLIVFGVLSMMWSDNNRYTLNYLTTKFPFITIGAFCVGAYMYDDASNDRILKLMTLAACIAALRFCYYTPWKSYYRGDFGILLDPNTNYNNYTSPLCMAFIIAAYYAFVRKSKMMLVPTAALAVVLVLAGSRKTIVVLPVIALFYLIDTRNYKKFLKGLLWSFVLILLLVVAIMNIEILSGIRESLMNAVNAYIFGQRSGIGNSTESRMYLVETAQKVWMEHPVWGVGWNNFRYHNALGLYSHNNYIEVLTCLGIVGFALYYSQHARTLYVALSKKNRRRNSWVKLVLGTLLGMLVIEVGAVAIYSREIMLIYLIVLTMYDRMNGLGRRITYI